MPGWRKATNCLLNSNHWTVRKLWVSLSVTLLLVSYACMVKVYATPAWQGATPDALWMDVSIGPPLVDWFNQTAGPQDIARVDHLNLVDLLDEVTVGRRLVVFKSISEAEAFLPQIAGKLEIIGYNLEHGPANPAAEQEDPLGSVQRMRALADQYGLQLALGPDRAFALNAGVTLAPYLDIIVLQVQQVQSEPETVRGFVLPLVVAMRQVNPALEISVQVSAEGEAGALVTLIGSMQEHLDGVSILTDHQTTDFVQTFVVGLRPALPAPSRSATPVRMTPPSRPTVEQPPARVESLEPLRRGPATGESVAEDAAAPAVIAPWLLWVGLLTVVMLVSAMLVTVMIYAYTHWRTRHTEKIQPPSNQR